MSRIPLLIVPPLRHRPLSDAEWEAIRPYLPSPARGGRPTDRRRILDAVFWIAASKEPWKSLPAHLGKPDSVSRALRRWARAGVLDRLLMAVSNHPLAGGCNVLRRLAWFICRAFRRMARVLPIESVMLARDLRMIAALPGPPWTIPHVPLFTRAWSLLADLATALKGGRLREFEALQPALRAATAMAGVGAGNLRKWRLR